MPGLAQRNAQFRNVSSGVYSESSADGFWSKHRGDVSSNQLQKFWSELSPQARQELLRIDKQTLFEQARKNTYCSRCNGLLLEGFLQIVMYGKSLQQEGSGGNFLCNRSGAPVNQDDSGLSMTSICEDDLQDPSVHPWGGLTTSREGSLTLLDCYLYAKSLNGLHNVFDSARARERERELLYPDACGGGGRGWISQGMASYGRGHGTRETCALHTARLSCDTLVDFWYALGEETRQSLLRMKEEDFFERLMYRFDSKRFCRDCRRNVIREFKELKELKRNRREPHCTVWFCVADSAFQYEVSKTTVQADWHQTFIDTVGTYSHFEWAVGTGEGKSDILDFDNVGMKGSVKVDGLDLMHLSALFITLRAWKLDGRCTELSVKAHALKGQQCVHCRLVVGDGFVTITRGESIRKFFEHAEEAEEEEDDDSMDKDGNELDGECSRPQKHAKSPELAREFLLDAATVIFKEQVEKAFREGTARQNAHSIFVSLALKLLEERVHVACKEIITLEKQTKLLEEEEREKREEEERKERRRTKEREKKLRRKERLKGKDRDREKNDLETIQSPLILDASKEKSAPCVDEEPNDAFSCVDSIGETCDITLSRPGSPDFQGEEFSNGDITLRTHSHSYDSLDGEMGNGVVSFTIEQSKVSRRRQKFRKEVQMDPLLWSNRRRCSVSERGAVGDKSEPRFYAESFESHSRSINGLNRQVRVNATKPNVRNCSSKFNSSKNWTSDGYGFHSCSCNQNEEYRVKVEPSVSASRSGRDTKCVAKSESSLDLSNKFYRGNKYSQIDYTSESFGRPKGKIISGINSASRDLLHSKKVWEPMESQKKYPRSNSDSDITMRSSNIKIEEVDPDNNLNCTSGDTCSGEVSGNSGESNLEDNNFKESGGSCCEMEGGCYSKEAANKELGLFPTKNSSLNLPNMSSTSTSDNCSSCLSEGDSNTASSNQGNLESSSTSDSEDASQQSEGKESSVCIQNGFSECHDLGMENKQTRNGVEAYGGRTSFGIPMGCAEDNSYLNPVTNMASNSDVATSLASIGAQHHGMVPPVPDQNLHFPIFQAPSTMGYYHQNPVSWSAVPANGLMSFARPNQYLYASPLGYGVNSNSHFCMPYGAVHNIAAPPFNPVQVPVYQPVANATAVNSEEHPQVVKSGAAREAFVDRVVAPAGPHPTETPSTRDRRQNDTSVKPNMGNTGFSLFHFGGPVALSTGHKQNPEALEEEMISKLSAELSADRDCNKKETTIEEYNLFATSNGIKFSIF